MHGYPQDKFPDSSNSCWKVTAYGIWNSPLVTKCFRSQRFEKLVVLFSRRFLRRVMEKKSTELT
jgi:hypothetical protein